MSIFEGPPGSTPLTTEEQEGLIPTWVATHGDLNRAEQDNIASATLWVGGRRWRVDDITAAWLRNLHHRMLSEVWDWAGNYRTRDVNIGGRVAPYQIPVAVETLVLDMREQVDVWTPDEVAVRFHHSLVSIHPFPNGNGRHSRLVADVLVEALGGTRFAWGGRSLTDNGESRAAYISALHRADDGDPDPLIAFARTPGL